jgi:hypothetical protein
MKDCGFGKTSRIRLAGVSPDGITSMHILGYADILIIEHVQQVTMNRSLDRIEELRSSGFRDSADYFVQGDKCGLTAGCIIDN